MPPPYLNPHWGVFSGIPHVPAGPVGYVPTAWVVNHGLAGVPAAAIPLPTHQLNRVTVRAICQNPANPVLFGYVCAMAWGLQGAGPGGAGHVAAAWAANALLIPKLAALRAGGLTRRQAYSLFTGANAVPGLGPAYFTKLLYFFLPVADCYIMDQHTGKSMGLLTGNWVVRMVGKAVSNLNKCGNYQAYCEEVDTMAGLVGLTGEQIEEMMMSRGGHHPWPWRVHVHANWPAQAPGSRYSRAAMHAIYPHISSIYF
jgi:hypothetical protein